MLNVPNLFFLECLIKTRTNASNHSYRGIVKCKLPTPILVNLVVDARWLSPAIFLIFR